VDNDPEQAVGVEQGREGRQRRSVQEKRQMVEATLVPGASIARVARAYGVNANQLFHWRKLYKQGFLEEPITTSARLLPVQIAELPSRELIETSRSKTPATTPTIRIEIAGKARLSIEGCDEGSLRTVLECLLR
jgi:transposase